MIHMPTARARKTRPHANGEQDGPPAPRAEVPELGVAVVDVRVETVLGQLAALRRVRAAHVEGDERRPGRQRSADAEVPAHSTLPYVDAGSR